jgi:hypothetical protein
MNCIRIIFVVTYIFALLKTARLAAKCSDIAHQNLKDGVADYRPEIFFDTERFTEKGLRFRHLSVRYQRLSIAIFVVGAILLILIFGNNT